MLKGWIICEEEDKEFLESLGVVVNGEYDEIEVAFMDCAVSHEAFEKLEPWWGRFYWGLSIER